MTEETSQPREIGFVYKKIINPITRSQIQSFLRFIVKKNNLIVSEYFDQMNIGSFFLLAATGLGKTVGVPVHLLQLQMQSYQKRIELGAEQGRSPTIWVVVPKIPIATSQAEYMNELIREFSGIEKAFLFGSRTSQGTVNSSAPIQFITTGVLPLIAQSGELDKLADRVVIDEAHVTLEADEAIEIAISLLKSQGIVVDFMSATVETGDLESRLNTSVIHADTSRFTNYYHNTGKPLAESIEDIIQATLVRYDTRSRYYPDWRFDFADSVLAGTNAVGRSSGLLIVVNSFAGANSDATTIAEHIATLCRQHGIRILLFAGKIERDKALKKQFVKDFEEIEKSHQKYVIITTNIVEMGITWSSLDYVVTMDSEYDNVDFNGFQVPQLVPLGTNALKQRGGRVGRKRAGCVYITKEFGTEYTDLKDGELNSGGLKNQPIRFPLTSVEPKKLAYLCVKNCKTTNTQMLEYLQLLKLPSAMTEGEQYSLLYSLGKSVQYYQNLGIMHDTPSTEDITPFNELPEKLKVLKLASRWIGTPEYPFVLEGMKALVNASEYGHFDSFAFYNYLAVLIHFPNKQLVSKGETVDPNSPDGLRVITGGNTIAPTFYPNNSDLVTSASILSEMFELEDFGKGGEVRDEVYSLDYDYPRMHDLLNAGYNPTVMKRFDKALVSHFEELKKQIDNVKLVDRDFLYYFNFIRDIESQDNSIGGAIDPNISKASIVRVKGLPSYVLRTYPNLLKLYRVFGVSFKLKEVRDQPGFYRYKTMVDGIELTGVLNQREHYCQLDTEHTFWGIQMPRTDRDSGEVFLEIEHIFREDLDVYPAE